jgi:hypothetical protein
LLQLGGSAVVLTDEQANAVDQFAQSSSLKISAFAGTGKTSTLSAIAHSTQRSGLYLAFNKSIAAEARSKFPLTVDCRTTHSIAFRAAPAAYKGNTAKLTTSLHGNHVVQHLELQEISVGSTTLKPRSLGFVTAKTIQRFCQSGDDELLAHHVPVTGKISQLHPDLQLEFRNYLCKLSAHLWNRMVDPGSDLPLGHDGYLKLWSLSKPRLNYDFLLLDEAQDTNEAVLSVLRNQDSHLTLVGDRHQQIYEWRGAINAMASVDTDADSALTQSFRFGEQVASAATSILKLLGEERPLIGNPDRRTSICSAGEAGTVLCRTNAGVVSVVFESLNNGRRPHVVGGTAELLRMLEDVSRLKRKVPAESPEFFGFADWAEVESFSETEEGESLRSFVKIVSTRGEAALTERLRSVEREERFANLIVSTAHKAKGREWDSVKLFSDFEPRQTKDFPPKSVMNREEARLLYVAATRARHLLVVPSRLADRWNVPKSPQVPESKAESPRAHTLRSTPPLPELPSFAKMVSPKPEGQRGSSSPSVAESTPLPMREPLIPDRPMAQAPAKSGILGFILSLFK